MNTLTQDEQDEQTLSVFDLQDELDAMEQGRMDYEYLEAERLYEELAERARTQSTSSEEDDSALNILCQVASEQPYLPITGRKRRYSEMEESEGDFSDSESEEESEDEYDEEGVGKCGFRCDDRCRLCEDGGFDSRDET